MEKRTESVDNRYKSIFEQYYFQDGNMDAVIVCAEVYVGIVTKLCNKIPSVFELLLAKKRQEEALIEDEPTIGKMPESVRPMFLPQENYDLLIQSYDSLTPKISIEKVLQGTRCQCS